ncbi:MAG: DUF512 domain-containing protein [Clostridiales bacterium]|nr:DUF512 domain-containing protein [Clostridiales bacterium]
MTKTAVVITGVNKNSPCGKKHILRGDVLISVNGREINDVLDYGFFISEKKLTLEVRSAEKQKIKKFTVRKDEYEDIGLEFETYLMDKQRRCANKCIFCFVDQLPKGMRESLYFKDDDSRLSFLFGNYITLTNLSRHEADRIMEMHISPVNVSVHTMNPELRVKMMKNKNAGKCLSYLKEFADAGIKLNTQLVLCPGINDGDELLYSLNELGDLYPAVQSIAAVPVGLTGHREGLFELKPYTKQQAGEVIDIIEQFNMKRELLGIPRTAYPADEFYLIAERKIPDDDYYGDYPQLENGVGLCALLKSEYMSALGENEKRLKTVSGSVTLATGEAAYPLIKELTDITKEKAEGLSISVIPIKNTFFGGYVNVSGLLTGKDYLSQLEGKDFGDRLLIPAVSLKRDEDIFLDDVTLNELEKKLGVKVIPVENDGVKLFEAVIGDI